MRKLACLAILFAACSSNDGNGAGGGGGGGNPDGGGGASDGFIPTDGPGIVMTDDKVIITMATFTLGPGEEVFKCQDFANPFGGADAEIQKFESHMTLGSHHMLLLYENNATDGALQDCSGLTFGPMPYGAQVPDAQVVYPDGVAALLKANQGFKLNVHYFNATQKTIQTSVQIVMYKATPGTVTQHAGVFFLNNVSALFPGIKAGETKTITASYTTTSAINLLYATAHMHSRSTNLTATYGADNTMLYTSDSWDNSPFAHFQPEIALPAGTTITWSCTIDNTTMGTLTFGESAMTNEMCIFDGQYYPVPAGADPTIDVMK